MQIDKAVARLEQQVVEAVNGSGLPRWWCGWCC